LPNLATALAERAGVSPGLIRTMTLAAYVPGLIDATKPRPGLFDSYTGQFGWFVAPGRRDGPPSESAPSWTPWRAGDLLSALPRCCPRCLVTDALPYVRLHWRLAWMASCPLHGEMLVPVAVSSWRVQFLREREPNRAAPDLLALDRITLGAATTGTATLPRGGGQVPGSAWLRALRTLLKEVARPMVWSGYSGRNELTRAWLRTRRMFDTRHGWEGVTFEHLSPEQRSVLLQVAGAVVRRQAVRPARHGPGTMLRAYVTQWNSGQLCGT